MRCIIQDDKEIIISYCDYGTVWDFERFIEETKNWDAMIPCYTGFHPHMLGSDNYAFCKEENKKLIQIKEKEPFTNNQNMEDMNGGQQLLFIFVLFVLIYFTMFLGAIIFNMSVVKIFPSVKQVTTMDFFGLYVVLHLLFC